ncbi:MAG: glycosyltransferase family 2 protein [Bacteroidaceae bacterium]|nr:glycosyltransferase family 2 protein [Bacteroidaceae bacterium]
MHSFSIIIPHHEIPTLLQRCLNSIPQRDDVQVIIVDDNSSPDKVDFARFPGAERSDVTLVFDKQGGGAGHARNLGLEHADGDWLVFADADDYFTQDFYEIISTFRHAEAQMVLFMADSVDSDTGQPSDRHQQLNDYVRMAMAGKVSAREASLAMPTPWCRMVRRDLVERCQIRFDETPSANDVMFVVKATTWADRVIVSDRVLYTVTTRAGSLWNSTRRSVDNYLCRVGVYIRRNRFYEEQHIGRKKPVLLYVWDARRYGLAGVWKTLCLALREGALFSGFGTLLWIVKCHIKGVRPV